MEDRDAELRARIAGAQIVKISEGSISRVMEGRVTVADALREAGRKPGDTVQGEHRDASTYDPVLRWHTRT